MYCENCEKEHEGSYGSGRFCCCKCARGFATKNKRKEINEKVSQKLKGDVRCAWNKNKKLIKRIKKQCQYCTNIFEVRITENQKFCSKECARLHLFQNTNWSKIQKDSYSNGRKQVGGRTKWYTVQTSNGSIRVQGTYEKRACSILDKWKESKKIKDWEYTNDRYQYTWKDGTEHTYLLDFKVIENDDTFWYLETKGFIRENDERKWEAIKALGHDLRVWFLEEIENFENGW